MQFFKYHLQGGEMKNKILMEVADTFGLKFLEDINEAAGIYENYFLSIRFVNNFYQCCFSLSQMGNYPDKQYIKSLRKEIKPIQGMEMSGYLVKANIKGGFTAKGCKQNILDSIVQLISHFAANGFASCSEVSGSMDGVSLYCLNGQSHFFTKEEYDQKRTEQEEKNLRDESRGPVGILLGIFGAIVGAFLGAIAVFLFSRMGFVTLYGGMIMAATTVLGYKLFAGKFGFIGIPVTILSMAAMVYLVNRLDFAFLLSEAYFGSFEHVMECFQYMKEILAEEVEEVGMSYTRNLWQLMIFTLATGIIFTIATFIAEKKAKPSYPILDESDPNLQY